VFWHFVGSALCLRRSFFFSFVQLGGLSLGTGAYSLGWCALRRQQQHLEKCCVKQRTTCSRWNTQRSRCDRGHTSLSAFFSAILSSVKNTAAPIFSLNAPFSHNCRWMSEACKKMCVNGKLCINKLFFCKKIPCTFSESSLVLVAGNYCTQRQRIHRTATVTQSRMCLVWSKCDVASQKTVSPPRIKLPCPLFIFHFSIRWPCACGSCTVGHMLSPTCEPRFVCFLLAKRSRQFLMLDWGSGLQVPPHFHRMW